jgi:hypothetical protein
MTSKLTKSKIQVSGNIMITTGHSVPEINAFYIDNEIKITLSGLKQSKSGVYEILNKFNGKRYIGNSKNMVTRKKHHWWDLEKGKHQSKEMQEDYNKFISTYPYTPGVDDIDTLFEFNVIIYCEVSELEFWERLLINSIHPEYNTKKKKELPPKVFDINGDKINNSLDDEIYESGDSLEEILGIKEEIDVVNFSDDDIEEEMM